MTDADVRRMLDEYTRTVRDLRAAVTEARGRVDRATAVVAEAEVFARRRRRRARKIAARRHGADPGGGPR